MPIVYVVQESPGKNILGAADFGEVKILLPSERQVIFSPGPVIFGLKNLLQKFSDEDFLLLIGDPVAIAMACMVASENNRGRIKLLKWDRQEARYYPLQIDLQPIKNPIQC